MHKPIVTLLRDAELLGIVAWYAHDGIWVEIARANDKGDAEKIAAMFNAALGPNAKANGEEYRAFHIGDFVDVVTNP